MHKFVELAFFISAFVVGYVKAESEEELKKEYADILTECVGEHPLSKEDLEALSNEKMTGEVKCIFACALRKTGMMDENGLLSPEGVLKSTKKYLSNDPEQLERAKMFIDACTSVNDASVSDGTKGCDRAVLIFQCTVEKAPTFDLF